eukprot:IDg15572t1
MAVQHLCVHTGIDAPRWHGDSSIVQCGASTATTVGQRIIPPSRRGAPRQRRRLGGGTVARCVPALVLSGGSRGVCAIGGL